MTVVQKFERNRIGRDFIVGDIHGQFSRLQEKLDAIGFDPMKGDRLFSVGDLVYRGPESDDVLDWLGRTWFHAIQGNHEDMAIMWAARQLPADHYIRNGGAWNVFNAPDRSHELASAFRELPVMIELETVDGVVGLVHADCPLESWREFIEAFSSPDPHYSEGARTIALWNRGRVEAYQQGAQTSPVRDVRAVVVGHTPMGAPTWINNVLHIDTGGWRPAGGYFTVLDARTLEPAKEIEVTP